MEKTCTNKMETWVDYWDIPGNISFLLLTISPFIIRIKLLNNSWVGELQFSKALLWLQNYVNCLPQNKKSKEALGGQFPPYKGLHSL